MILDTTFIIDLMKNRAPALVKAQELEKYYTPTLTTTISVFELWQGLEDIHNEEKEEQIERFLSSIGLLGFDLESAKLAGQIHAELERRGELIQAQDSMIAGIAQQHGEPILTRNVEHFRRIKGIMVETYR